MESLLLDDMSTSLYVLQLFENRLLAPLNSFSCAVPTPLKPLKANTLHHCLRCVKNSSLCIVNAQRTMDNTQLIYADDSQ